jgi:hypothetical protein
MNASLLLTVEMKSPLEPGDRKLLSAKLALPPGERRRKIWVS